MLLESGESLPGVEIAFRTWGTLDEGGSNAVLVCHALTGSADLDLWWPGLLGPGRSLDWNGLTRNATGEPLNAKAFAEDLKAR